MCDKKCTVVAELENRCIPALLPCEVLGNSF